MSLNPLGSDNPFLNILLKNKDIQDDIVNLSIPVSTQPQTVPSFYIAEGSNQSADAALNHLASKVKDSDGTQQIQHINNNQDDIEPFVVKVSVQDLGEDRWSSKIDPDAISRQICVKAAIEMGLDEKQASEFAERYKAPTPRVKDGNIVREMKRSDLDNRQIIEDTTDEWGRYSVKVQDSVIDAIQDYKAKLKQSETNQGATPILLAGTTAVMPSQPITLELPKVVPVVTKAAPLLAEAAVPTAMLGAGVAAQAKVLYDWGQIEYARQAANAKTNVMPLPPPTAIMTDKTDTKTPVVPDTSIPTDEELPKGELTKAGPATTSAPATPTTTSTSPTGGAGQGPDKIPPIVGPIIGGITGTIGTLAGSSSTTGPERTQPSLQPDPNRMPSGKAEDETDRGKIRENESAKLLAQVGYDVEQSPTITADDVKNNPSLKQVKNPDYRIEGKIFDCYAPDASRALNLHVRIAEKATKGQTTRLVLNLDDSKVSLDELQEVLTDTPISNLQEIIIIKDGKITHFFPFE